MNHRYPPPRPVRVVLLGPVPCQVCRRPVEWDGMGWLFRGSNLIHNILTCPGANRGVVLPPNTGEFLR